MMNYRIMLKKRLIWLICFNCIALILIVLSGMHGSKTVGNAEDFINGFQIGIFIGAQLSIIYLVVKYIKGLKNEEKLKILYIEENDERTKLIRDKIGGIGFFFSVAIITSATIIAGFFSKIVFFTLLAVTIFMVMVLASLKLYYKNRY